MKMLLKYWRFPTDSRLSTMLFNENPFAAGSGPALSRICILIAFAAISAIAVAAIGRIQLYYPIIASL